MKRRLTAFSMLLTMTAGSSALAVGPGKLLEFGGGESGAVIFDGTTHANAGLTCKDCHNADIFPKMKHGTVKITMNDLYAGRFCGKCHDGKTGFSIKENCAYCHYKAGA